MTADELNYVDGVTSNIQTQLDAKGTGTVSSLSDLSVNTMLNEHIRWCDCSRRIKHTGWCDLTPDSIDAKGTGTVSSLSDLSVTSTAQS